MYINDLPTEILVAIAAYSCEELYHVGNPHKRSFNILSVCRKWRQFALPVVYKKVNIVYVDTLWTEMDIMPESMKYYPRIVVFRVDSGNGDPIGRIESALDKLEMHKEMLDKVNTLNVSAQFLDFGANTNNNISQNEKMFYQAAERLKRLLPNVTTLNVNGYTNTSACITFETALFNVYSPQLVHAKIDSLALNAKTDFKRPLSSFILCKQSGMGSGFRTINVSSLTKLSIHSVDESFNWGIFLPANTTDVSVLSFPALECMFVSVCFKVRGRGSGVIQLQGPTNRFPYVLETPKLRHLKVGALCPLTCSLLSSITTPRPIARLCVDNNENINITLYGLNMAFAIKRIFEKYSYNFEIDTDIDAIELANDLQHVGNVVDFGIHAHVMKYISSDYIQRIFWPQVTRLVIDVPMSVSNILILIANKMPNVTLLEMDNVKIDSLDNDLNLVANIQNNVKLRSIVYHFYEKENTAPEDYQRFEAAILDSIKTLRYCTLKQVCANA